MHKSVEENHHRARKRQLKETPAETPPAENRAQRHQTQQPHDESQRGNSVRGLRRELADSLRQIRNRKSLTDHFQ